MATQSAPLLDAVHTADALQAFGLRSNGAQPAGSWKLAGGSAVTLHDVHAAVLRITHGRVWATVDGPHCGPANNLGDLVLNAGERLTVQAGQRVVIEPWGSSASGASRANEAVYFSWDPALDSSAVPLQGRGHRPAQAGSRMQVAVVYPLRDVGLALKDGSPRLGTTGVGHCGPCRGPVCGYRRVFDGWAWPAATVHGIQSTVML